MGIDLHIHSNASDGAETPRAVVRRATDAHLDTIALTDHDTIEGCPDAASAGYDLGVRVIPGCEFSVAAPWGEMHLLAYYLPLDDERLLGFMRAQQEMRIRRVDLIVERLAQLGVVLAVDDVLAISRGGSVGRPHVARALVDAGAATDIGDAFRRYLGARKPAFVPKQLPELGTVTGLVRTLCGVTSAAHLRWRANKANLTDLMAQGVDAVEVVHPAHPDVLAAKISGMAEEVGLLMTGGSDWHGADSVESQFGELGAAIMPYDWLKDLDDFHSARVSAMKSSPS